MKKILSIVICICMILSVASSITFTTYAATVYGTTNQYTYIRLAPYWTAQVVDTVASGTSITIYERDYDYLYVQYVNGGITKRGYIPLSSTNQTGYGWCNNGIFNNGYNNTGASQTVYYRPVSGSSAVGTIDSNEGIASNKPIIVLRQEGSYYYIQYITNTSNTGSEHVKYKRGWILSSKITLISNTSATPISGIYKYYIKNVATGLYLDLQGYLAGNYDGGNVHLWSFHGGWNQEWTIMQQPAAGTSHYIRLITSQGSEGRVLRVSEKTAVVGNNIDIALSTNPSKELDLMIESAGNGEYYIKTRCSGNYMMIGVSPSDSGVGGEIYMRFPSNSNYNKWIFEKAYLEGIDYDYTILGKIPSDISNGINAKYNIDDINLNRITALYDVCFSTENQQVLNMWSSNNTRITLSSDSNSENEVIWNSATRMEQNSAGILSYVYGSTHILDEDNSKDITMYFGSIYEHCAYDLGDEDFIPILWKFTLAHELGHTLGLDEAPINATFSIMSNYVNEGEVTSPHKADIAGVKKNYSLQYQEEH